MRTCMWPVIHPLIPTPCRPLQIQSALSRERKEETVEALVEKLSGSTVVFGMRMKGINVRALPCGSHMLLPST